MRIKKNVTVIFLIITSFSIFSQETVKNIDSLLILLSQAKNDSSKVHLFQKIAGHYNVTYLDSAKAFAEKGIQLAKKIDDQKGQWINLNALGNYYERKTQYDLALKNYNEALDIIKKNNDTKGFAVILNNIATIHIRKANYDKALYFLFEALKAEEQLENENGIAQAYNNIGVVYYYLQNFKKTTEYLTKALKMQEKLGNYDGLINGYNNVGAIFDYQKKYDEAIQSYQKALAISKKISDKKMEAIELSNIAIAYGNKKEMETANTYFNQSIAMKEEIKDYSGLSKTYTSFGEMLIRQQQYTQAKNYLFKALEIANEHDLKLSKKLIYNSLSEMATSQKNFKEANRYLTKLMFVKDSILSENNLKTIAEVETKYETEKKEKEIFKQRSLLAENKLELKKKNQLIFGSLAFAVILGLFGYLLYNQQKLKNKQMQKENELKTALVKIETQNKLQEQRLRISRDLHDNIGSHLTFIISSIDNLTFRLKDEIMSKKLRGLSKFTTQTIYELRDTIWAMNKNDISLEDLQVRINNFINQAKEASQTINFAFNITNELDKHKKFTSIDGMNIYRIIQEAINNAIKYADASQVEVDIHQEKSNYIISIKDNGKGFHVEDVELSNGINNMKKRAKHLKGLAKIESVKGKGTTVSIIIPV